MDVPFVDLRVQYDALKPALNRAMQSVCEETRFILGRDVREFEDAFAAYLGIPHAVGVASGTDALHLALRALGIGPGDEVVTVANTFIATVSAIAQSGARAVLVDCLPDTYNMDPAALERAITAKTRAVIPVHPYGQAADMDAILSVARAHGLKVVEDACQAHGAYYGGKRVGTLGDAGCFSFYPGKNLGAYGDGGAVVTHDAEMDRKLRVLRDHGQEEKYRHVVKGFNSRLDGLQAAILSVKLPHLDSWNAARAANARAYGERLAGLPGVVLPSVSSAKGVAAHQLSHVFHLYVVRVNERDRVAHALSTRGVHTGIHYPVPVHLHPAFADLGYGKGSFPIAEECAARVLSLPMYAELTGEQIAYVCDGIRAAVGVGS